MKQVRIENADASTRRIVVWVEDQQPDGAWVRDDRSYVLDHPTALCELVIWPTRRLVVEQVP